MEIVLKQLKDKLQKFDGIESSENDVSNRVVLWLLEEYLGYDRDDMRWETSAREKKKDRRIDIMITLSEEKKLLVETKRYEKDLDEEDLMQLLDYMIGKNVEWGILTNGREFLLISKSIDAVSYGKKYSDINDKVVLNIQIGVGSKKGKNEKYLKYLSKEQLFERNNTNYYRDIAYFFALHELSDSSKGAYVNTLYNFFDFYIGKGKNYIEYSRGGHRALEDVSENDVVEFFKEERPHGRPYTGKVPKSKCAHITTMYNVLQGANYIQNHRLENLLERANREFMSEETNIAMDNNILTIENVGFIMNKLKEKNKPNKILIFTLCAYYGFDRGKILEFCAMPWSFIQFEKKRFELGGKYYPMVKVLAECLEEMRRNYKDKGVTPKSIYVTKHNGKYYPVKSDTINMLFDEDIKKLQEKEVDWKILNPQSTRAMLIYNMFASGCTIEHIAYLTGATVSQIMRYIPNSIIEEMGKKKWEKKQDTGRNQHPYKKIFDNEI